MSVLNVSERFPDVREVEGGVAEAVGDGVEAQRHTRGSATAPLPPLFDPAIRFDPADIPDESAQLDDEYDDEAEAVSASTI